MTFYYFMSYLAEALTLMMFNENAFTRKTQPEHSKYRTPLCYLVSFAVNFGISFIGIPKINLFVFVISTFFVIYFGYSVKPRKIAFITLLLTVFMFFTELVVIFFSSAVFGIELYSYEDNAFIFVTQASISKLLYSVVVFLVMKLFFSEKYSRETDKYLIWLGILPAASVFVFIFLISFHEKYPFSEGYGIGLTVGTLLLLLANIIVFYIYSLIQKTDFHITELTLEKQKEKSTREYYEMLVAKQDNYGILVHDIKRHLQVIDFYAENENCSEIINYIDSVRESFGLDGKIQCSGNKLIDVIVGRYVNICKENNIAFTADTVCSVKEFLNEADLASLLDNMFENAVESAKRSEDPFIRFSIATENGRFLIISIENSCDTPPKFKNGIPVNTKQGKNHGIGIKSMKKAAERSEGKLTFNFNENERTFTCQAVFMV